MHENEIARLIVDAAYQIHTTLGPGLLESVYKTLLAYQLEKRGLIVTRQAPVPLIYEEISFDEGFRADLVVQGKVIVELKSIEKVAPVHKKQLLTYLPPGQQPSGTADQFWGSTGSRTALPA